MQVLGRNCFAQVADIAGSFEQKGADDNGHCQHAGMLLASIQLSISQLDQLKR
jgi:hypothetical protein